MYSENRWRDLRLFAKAVLSNALARFAPGAYVRLTGQTGRGSEQESADDIAGYFVRCVADYREQLGLDEAAFAAFLQGRRVLEYGPGDVLGVALLLYAAGAQHVHCVDRFALQQVSPKNAEVYRSLMQGLPAAQRQRAAEAFRVAGDPTSGLRPECIEYRITADGLSARREAYDFVISRAVLEHVNLLERTLADVEQTLVPGGLSVHSVDLRSHNLDRDRPFDFLTWPDWAYRLMYSHKGFPNRWRSSAYRAALQRTRLKLHAMRPSGELPGADVDRIAAHLPRSLRGGSAAELGWLGFWMVLERPR